MNETTVSGSIAAGPAVGLGTQRRVQEEDSDDGTKAPDAPKAKEFGLWKNSVLAGAEQRDKKKSKKVAESKSEERNEMDTPAVQSGLKKMAARHNNENWTKEQLADLGRRLASVKTTRKNGYTEFNGIDKAIIRSKNLEEDDLEEGWKNKLAGAALAGAAALGGGGQAQAAPTDTGSNATIVKSLVNPAAQQRFAAQHADTTAKLSDLRYDHNPDALSQHNAYPKEQHDQWIQNVKNVAEFDNPYQIIRTAMNMAGVTPQEVLQNLPKGFKLPTTEPKGTFVPKGTPRNVNELDCGSGQRQLKLAEENISEEQLLAKELARRLDLFMKGMDRELGKKSSDRGIQSKTEPSTGAMREDNKSIGPDKNDPFEKGWRARYDDSNPYEKGTKEYNEWQNGKDEREAQPNHYDESVTEQYDPATAIMWINQVSQLAHAVSQMSPEELVKLNDAYQSFYKVAGGAVAGGAATGIGGMFYSLMKDTLSAAKSKARVDTEEIIQLQRQIVSIHKRLKTLKSEPAIAKYQAMLKQAYEVLEELESRQGNQVAEGDQKQLSVQQLATISDEALDNAYHYGRSSPGNTFGWQANLKSAAYAKQMIDKGITDIEAISDAIHKGWNVTAKAFVQNPDQFDDTEKLKAAGKLEAKLQQREKLMNIGYAQLPDEEQEKDRVVARALLQALKGQQDVAEDSDPCWSDYKQVGMKKKNGKKVPNCVPKEGVAEDTEKEYHVINHRGTPTVVSPSGKMNKNFSSTYDAQQFAKKKNAEIGKKKDVAEDTASVKYGVFSKGGSVGDQKWKNDPIKTFDNKEEAIAFAKHRRAGLSKGEKAYYRMSYVVKPIKNTTEKQVNEHGDPWEDPDYEPYGSGRETRSPEQIAKDNAEHEILSKKLGLSNKRDKDSMIGDMTKMLNHFMGQHSKKKDVDEGLGKSIKRAAQGWGSPQDKPADIVKRNKGYDIDTAKKVRAGIDGAADHTPQGLQKRVLDRKLKGVTESTGYKSQFPSAAPAIQYAKDKVKTFRDPDDGIEIWSMPDGGCDVVHTSNSNGRYHVIDNRGKKLGTIRPQKQGNK